MRPIIIEAVPLVFPLSALSFELLCFAAFSLELFAFSFDLSAYLL